MTLRAPLLYLVSLLSLLVVGCGKGNSNQVTPPVVVASADVSTLAGSVPGKPIDGTGNKAVFAAPADMVTDASGNVYVADVTTVRKITPEGVVTSLGIIPPNPSGAHNDAPNTKGITMDANGNIYACDLWNSVIRKISTSGQTTVFIGQGPQTNEVDGDIKTASFNQPGGLCMDKSGNIYVAVMVGNVIVKITPAGVATTIAGTGKQGNQDGAAATATFNLPHDVAVDASGNLYVADGYNNMIRKITPAGIVSTFAGSGNPGAVDGTGTQAQFHTPTSIDIDQDGNLYVADGGNNKIRKITPSGVVTTIAGSGKTGHDDGAYMDASFNYPWGIAVSKDGKTVFVADYSNALIRKIKLK